MDYQGRVLLSNTDYHAAPGISKSHLDQVARSPKHYFARYLDPAREPEAPTAAMTMGTAVHTAVLEPETFEQAYVVAPEGIDRRTNAGKAAWAEFLETAIGRHVLSAEEMRACLAVSAAVRSHPLASKMLRMGEAEQSFFNVDEATGALVKCRPDYWRAGSGMIIDLKTALDASPSAFGRSAATYRYHVQAGFYMEILEQLGMEPQNFVFVAVEKTAPYAVGVYYIEPEALQAGRAIARRDLERILACRTLSAWPDYTADAPQPLQVPAWALTV